MKFFIKDAEGNLVEATQDQILDAKSVLFNEDGEQLNKSTTTDSKGDSIKELSGMVKELVGGVTTLKEENEKVKEELEAFKSAQSKGSFPVPTYTPEDKDESTYKGFDLAMQGSELQRRWGSKYQIPEEKKNEIAKFFILFLKAGLQFDLPSVVEFRNKYSKTAIGDSGNVFPVPDIVESEILHFAREKSAVLQYANVVNMTSEKQSYPQETGGTTSAWGNTTTQSDPTISEVELTAYELSSFTEVRNTTLADSRSDIVSWLTSLMAEAQGQALDDACFNGDGTSSYGYCSGVLSAKAGYSVVMGSSSTSFADLDSTVLSEMIAKLDGLRKEGACFWMNGAVLHYLRTLEDTQGRPIFFAGDYGGNVPPQLMGFPYKEVIKCPSTDAVNTAFISFGNLRYFMAGRRLETMQLQVDPYGLWTTNRTRFKIYHRWGLNIGLPNGFVRLLTASS